MKKGFTLIELLAVIVILAIIALIATPIILGIINDARKESQERSVELYASAVRNGIVANQLRTGKEFEAKSYKTSDLDFVEYEGNVECDTIEIYEDGGMYVADCKVNGITIDYTYGTKQELPYKQVYKPQYYYYILDSETGEPVSPSSVPPTDRKNYLGYGDADYVCFVRNEKEYCLKHGTESYETNISVIKDAFKDVVDTDACSLDNGEFSCNAAGISAFTSSDGMVDSRVDSKTCYISPGGVTGCD